MYQTQIQKVPTVEEGFEVDVIEAELVSDGGETTTARNFRISTHLGNSDVLEYR